MKKIVGIVFFLAAISFLIISRIISSDIKSIYTDSDVEAITQAIDQYAETSAALKETYSSIDEKALPEIIKVLKSTRDLVHGLDQPAKMLNAISHFNFRLPYFDRKYPFSKFQESTSTFAERTRPETEKTLDNVIPIFEDFQQKQSPKLLQSFAKTEEALSKCSERIKIQRNLNQRIAKYVFLLGTLVSLLCFLVGVYCFTPHKQE